MLGCFRAALQYILKISHPQKFYFAHKICIDLVPTLMPFLVVLLLTPSPVIEGGSLSWLHQNQLMIKIRLNTQGFCYSQSENLVFFKVYSNLLEPTDSSLFCLEVYIVCIWGSFLLIFNNFQD